MQLPIMFNLWFKHRSPKLAQFNNSMMTIIFEIFNNIYFKQYFYLLPNLDNTFPFMSGLSGRNG